MTEFIINELSKPEMNKPVLIEGLPGIGNVARLTVDYLIDKLGATKFCELFSDSFPNTVSINNDSVINMFSIKFYYAKAGGQDVVLMAGDVQPASDAESYALCRKIMDLCHEWGVSELITIGGIGLPETPDKTRVHAVVNDKELINKLSDLSLIIDGNETVKLILGATGLLLGVAKLDGLNGLSLLAETSNEPQHVGIKEAREILRVLTKYLGVEIDFSEINDEINSYEQEISNEPIINPLNDGFKRQAYIG